MAHILLNSTLMCNPRGRTQIRPAVGWSNVWGGAMALKSRHRMRVIALQRENEGVKWGEMGGCPLPSRQEGLGERRELPSGVRGEAPPETHFGVF